MLVGSMCKEFSKGVTFKKDLSGVDQVFPSPKSGGGGGALSFWADKQKIKNKPKNNQYNRVIT